ncbi:pyridoxal phosphate-dependent transferase [Pavlovales sp. CCMP2436]|nr:pyridoxal phosphate-dependent transferase [Pavlovales sp. CCMP2436]|mmetsp:Transcript_13257/g.33687  ORF Transcript_13257/g.33687 Transcript_13257/m.33687 type:complete len:476 (-) Transcript_13257:264-1691(-)|eukprot:CAMPEP_0180068914 /NCGR_PEP_ID=MMETSP0985-20121206/10700_1 /TAXON_ID=483367 /ORGANISM="non described non described, Strain CCMP 2436" /LENGTH=475 /DNA_ID=CAMNT_0021999777 /DNA_START=25 /DNA_END=1452 /DNA_ORIENTATION=+
MRLVVLSLLVASIALARGKASRVYSPSPTAVAATAARTAPATRAAPTAAKTAFASPADAAAAGPRMSRTDERKTCPVPDEGIEHAVRLMRDGMLFRYTYPSGETSPVSEAETALAAYTGHKYCIAVNSGASALYLSMVGAGVKPGDKVLCNAFTFGAVPSAIVHAGAEVVYVESTDEFVLDVEELRKTLTQHPDAKALMLSHMRGRVSDMEPIKAICDEAGVILLEDCAHSLGVRYKGLHTGHYGVACGVSAQAFKLLNSGEGGFCLTDDPEIAMRVAVLAGAYESNALKHNVLPEIEERFSKLAVQLPNLSMRMSALAASVLIPQVHTLDERITEYELRYNSLKARLAASPVASYSLVVPDDLPEVNPVHDELLFAIKPEALERAGGDAAVAAFMKACAARGLTMNLFGSKTNARNFVNWQFAPHGSTGSLPRTAEVISRSFGIRLPLQWEREDIASVFDVLEWCAAEVFGTPT